MSINYFWTSLAWISQKKSNAEALKRLARSLNSAGVGFVYLVFYDHKKTHNQITLLVPLSSKEIPIFSSWTCRHTMRVFARGSLRNRSQHLTSEEKLKAASGVRWRSCAAFRLVISTVFLNCRKVFTSWPLTEINISPKWKRLCKFSTRWFHPPILGWIKMNEILFYK